MILKIKGLSTDSHQISYEKLISISACIHTQILSLMTRSLHKLHNLEKIFKKFKISTNLNSPIDFG